MFGLLGIIAEPLVIAFLLALLRLYERDLLEHPAGTANAGDSGRTGLPS